MADVFVTDGRCIDTSNRSLELGGSSAPGIDLGGTAPREHPERLALVVQVVDDEVAPGLQSVRELHDRRESASPSSIHLRQRPLPLCANPAQTQLDTFHGVGLDRRPGAAGLLA